MAADSLDPLDLEVTAAEAQLGVLETLAGLGGDFHFSDAQRGDSTAAEALVSGLQRLAWCALRLREADDEQRRRAEEYRDARKR